MNYILIKESIYYIRINIYDYIYWINTQLHISDQKAITIGNWNSNLIILESRCFMDANTENDIEFIQSMIFNSGYEIFSI